MLITCLRCGKVGRSAAVKMDGVYWLIILNWGVFLIFKRFADFLSLLIVLEFLVVTVFT